MRYGHNYGRDEARRRIPETCPKVDSLRDDAIARLRSATITDIYDDIDEVVTELAEGFKRVASEPLRSELVDACDEILTLQGRERELEDEVERLRAELDSLRAEVEA